MAKKLNSDELSKSSGAKKDMPTGNTPSWTIRLPLDLREFLERRAADDDRSLAYLVIKILTDWAKKQGFKG